MYLGLPLRLLERHPAAHALQPGINKMPFCRTVQTPELHLECAESCCIVTCCLAACLVPAVSGVYNALHAEFSSPTQLTRFWIITRQLAVCVALDTATEQQTGVRVLTSAHPSSDGAEAILRTQV